MNNSQGYRVEYSDDLNEVCIIPHSFISIDHMTAITDMYIKLGYKFWLPADERRGFIYVKDKKKG